jgi:hypothetical protein
MADPSIWPFSSNFSSYYASHSRPLPKPLFSPSRSTPLSSCLRVDDIFVFNDSRDWGLDTQIVLDLLLSHRGYLGTVSEKNNDSSLPNYGFQQDEQPVLYFSNPDLWWAAEYHLNRLGQGGFREAFEGVWEATTGDKKGVELQKRMFGKPSKSTYAFAERRLERQKEEMMGAAAPKTLRRVYMVGGQSSYVLGI